MSRRNVTALQLTEGCPDLQAWPLETPLMRFPPRPLPDPTARPALARWSASRPIGRTALVHPLRQWHDQTPAPYSPRGADGHPGKPSSDATRLRAG